MLNRSNLIMESFCIQNKSKALAIYTYKCFPVRKTKFTENNGGAWYVDFCTKRNNKIKLLNISVASDDNNGLDFSKEYLMKQFCLKDPSELYILNISGRSLHPSANTDFSLFENVSEIDASDNNLTLESFSTFRNIQKLYLQANNIKFMDVNCNDFVSLQKLDLSYNCLSMKALLNIGKLQSLEELLLCGCGIKILPDKFYESFKVQSDVEGSFEVCLRFVFLSLLDLSENLLTENVFECLAALPRLKILKLGNNKICSIPHFSYQYGVHHSGNPSFQFLNTLDLSNNQISHEDSLLSLISWPKLMILMLWGNPIIDIHKNNSNIYENFEKIYGIKVFREKPNQRFLRNCQSSAKNIINMAKIINKSIPRIKRDNLQLLKFNSSNSESKLSNKIKKRKTRKKNNLFQDEPIAPDNSIYNDFDELRKDYKTKTKNVFLTQLNEEAEGEFYISQVAPIEEENFDFEETEKSIKKLPLSASVKRLKAILYKQRYPSLYMDKTKVMQDKQTTVNKVLEEMRLKKPYIKENLAVILDQCDKKSEFQKHYREVKKLAQCMQQKYDEVRKELLKPILLSNENEVCKEFSSHLLNNKTHGNKRARSKSII